MANTQVWELQKQSSDTGLMMVAYELLMTCLVAREMAPGLRVVGYEVVRYHPKYEKQFL